MEIRQPQRRSKQRDAIRELITSGRLDHPSADELFAELKKKHKNISLGTVYRNLNMMSESGEISKISGSKNGDRFDCTTNPHAHFKCDKCGKLLDISSDLNFLKALTDDGFDVTGATVLIRGVCPECIKKSSKINNPKKGK